MGLAARRALIVASSRYDDPAFRALRTPVGDAESLARVLADPEIGGFEVRSLVNEQSWVVAEEIEGFFADRGRDDLLVLYFSCHGVKDQDGRLYFVASNTKLKRLGASGVSSQFVNEQMNRSRSRRIVLLLDCCYSGAFTRLATKSDYQVDVGERFDGHGRVVLTASSAMEYAFEGDQLSMDASAPSVFTGALVHGLATGDADLDDDGRISINELYDYVFEQVRETTPDQTPGFFAGMHGGLVIARNVRRPADRGRPLELEVPPVEPAPVGPSASPRRGPANAATAPRRARPAASRGWRFLERSMRVLVRRRWPLPAVGVLVAVLLVLANLLWDRPSEQGPPPKRWMSIPDVPGPPIEGAGVAAHAGRIWVTGGVSGEQGRPRLNAVWVYDPGARRWSAGPKLPAPRSFPALVSTGRELLLIGGLGATGQSERTVYRLGSDGSWRDAPDLPDDRAVGAAAWDGSRVVFAGGVARDGQARADVWSFDGAAWRRVGNLQVARDKLAAVSDGNGEVWFLGGRNPATERPLGDVDVVRRRPTYLGEQVQPVQGAGGIWWPGAGPCLAGGGGGSDGKRALDLVQCPPVRGSTITPPPLPRARIGLGAAVLDNVVYVVGGFYAGVNGSNLAETFAA